MCPAYFADVRGFFIFLSLRKSARSAGKQFKTKNDVRKTRRHDGQASRDEAKSR